MSMPIAMDKQDKTNRSLLISPTDQTDKRLIYQNIHLQTETCYKRVLFSIVLKLRRITVIQ